METNLKRQLVTTCTKLDIQADIDSILAEIEQAKIPFRTPEENDRGNTHDNVSSFFLRGNAKMWEFSSSIDDNSDENSEYLQQLPALKIFLKQFPGNLKRIALLKLKGNSVIPSHRDKHESGYFEKAFRFHVPLITFEDVFFFASGQFFTMQTGEVWTVNNLGMHGVINNNQKDRTHLVFDVEVNENTIDFIRDMSTESLGKDGVKFPELMEKLSAPHKARQGIKPEKAGPPRQRAHDKKMPKRRGGGLPPLPQTNSMEEDIQLLIKIKRRELKVMERLLDRINQNSEEESW